MSFTVKFCNSSSPREKIGKSLTSGSVFSCSLKEGTSVYRPTLLIKSDADVSSYNYMQIPQFNRSYFIEDCVLINGLWEVTGHVDVLETYKAQILNNDAVIKRQQNKYNLYLDDPDFRVYNNESIQTLQFPSNNFMKSLQYILVTDSEV